MKTYTYNEALKASTDYFDGDDLAGKVWVDKYARTDKDGNLLEKTPEDMFDRLAGELARIDKLKFADNITKDEFKEHLNGFKRIVLQGSPMYGIGNTDKYVSIGNCFVISNPLDSYLGIMHTDTEITQISCRRGGVGWDISNLRPKDLAVQNAAKTTTGAISFLKRFSNTIREVAQNGRRAASLQSISCYHPDVEEFIDVKRDLTQVTGSNISVQFDDAFMAALEKDEEINLRWPVSGRAKIKKPVRAKDIWDKFIESAHAMAEPGCAFISNVHKMSPGVPYGHVETSSNPCGEQYLPPYASCRLLLLNLMGYVDNPYTGEAWFDVETFKKDVALLVRIGDHLVDLEIESVDRIIDKIKQDPEPDYIKQPGLDLWENVKRVAEEDRRMGCGFTALGDMLAALGLKYDSDEAIEFIEELQKTYALSAYRASVDLAKALGPFPLFDPELDKTSGFVKLLKKTDPKLYEDMQQYGRRNMVLMTIAPTGSVSCLTQTTSGLEPVFQLSYFRRKKGNPGDKGFRTDFVDQNGDSWMNFEVKHRGQLRWEEANPDYDPEESPYYGCTAGELDWVKRVDIQAALQKWTDNSISVTINLPEDVSIDTVDMIYREAYKKGCKGVTIYRDNCRSGVLVTNTDKEEDSSYVKRPQDLPCDVHHLTVKGDPYFVLVGLLDEKPYELWAGRNGFLDQALKIGVVHKMKRPKCYRAEFEDGSVIQPITVACNENEEALTRLISMSLRHGTEIQDVVDQLQKTQGPMTSLAKAMARALKKYVVDGSKSSQKCPECGSKLTFQEGCLKCDSCGHSKCG